MKHYYKIFTPVLGALLFLSANQTQSQSNLGANPTQADARGHCYKKKPGKSAQQWELENFPNGDKCVVQYSQH